MKPKVICIVGPTATGKSDVGVAIAKKLNTEVISADSMQVYRGMDIGTAKLTPGEMNGVPHHMIDIVNPEDEFTVAQWAQKADSVIQSLHCENKIPIVVGGTGLYIRAITENLDFARQPGSTEVRDKWRTYYEQNGKEALFAALQAVDEASAMRLHPNDVRRVIRALEVYELRSVALSSDYDWSHTGGRYDTLQLAIGIERPILYERVNTRVDKMMEKGLLHEVKSLLAHGVSSSAQSMQAIGYKEFAAHLNGQNSLEEAIGNVKQATRRFVKRQLSWFSRDQRIIWMDQSALGHAGISVEIRAMEVVENFLAGI